MDNNVYLSSIKGAFTDYVPFIIVGSFGNLVKLTDFQHNHGTGTVDSGAGQSGSGIFSHELCGHLLYDHTDYLSDCPASGKGKEDAAFYHSHSLCDFLSLHGTQCGDCDHRGSHRKHLRTWKRVLGAQGLFIGMLVAVLITNLFQKLTSIEKIKIKMPDSVPQGIAVSFNILIPVFIIIVISAVFGTVFQILTGSYINEFIYNVVQAPVSAVVQTTPGIVIMAVVCQLFWFLGITAAWW